jgi:hypothetical protein
MNRRITTIAAVIVAAAAVVGVVFATEAGASHPSRAADTPGHPSISSTYEVSAYGLIVNIKNDSSYPMMFLNSGGKEPKEAPKPVLHPGDTDRLVYSADSAGMSVRLTYQVGGTQETVFPGFAVPIIGPNGFACSANDRSAKSPVGSKCDIGKNWQPDAHLAFVNR